MKDDIIVGLDVGSTAIRLVVGQKVAGASGEDLQIIGAMSGLTAGVNRGMVNSIEETTSSISAVIEKAERLVGVPISNAWVSINDPRIKCTRSRGVIAVGRSDGEINDIDVERAIESASQAIAPANYETMHTLPIRFSIDDQTDIKDPVGMSGIRLEAEVLMVQGFVTQMKNLSKAVFRTGIEINDIILAPLAAASAILSSKQKDLGVALIDIGSTTTSIAVYEEKNLIHTAILPIGSEHITSDIAIGLRCPINLAERIKREYGSAIISNDPDDKINVSHLAEEEEINDDIDFISKKYISEIINARVEEILDKIDQEFKKIDRSGMLPAGAIFVGGGAELHGLVEVAKSKLRLPAAIGSSKNVNVIIDKVRSPEFATALGLVVWADKHMEPGIGGGGKIKNNIKNISKKVKGLFNHILPK